MSDETALVPSETRTVDFYGDPVTGALVPITGAEPRIYVPVRPICEALGLSWGSQRNRLNRDEVLREAVRGVFITNTPGTGGGTQEMLCLPLDLLPGWLFGVSTQRVKPELHERILRYRRDCFRVLWDAFKHDILQSAALVPAQPLGGAAMAYEMATALQTIAREQMQLEQRMGTMETSQDRARQWAKDINARVSALEVRLGPDQPLSTEQAGELALHVKNIAYVLEQSGERNGYQRVYAEMYRRYSINSYKNLPQDRFAEVMQWLQDWYQEIGNQGNTKT